jgi:hypothetical protein
VGTPPWHQLLCPSTRQHSSQLPNPAPRTISQHPTLSRSGFSILFRFREALFPTLPINTNNLKFPPYATGTTRLPACIKRGFHAQSAIRPAILPSRKRIP